MKAISFYSPELAEMAQYQKAVFDHFGLEIEQVCVDMPTHAHHGAAIDEWLKNNEWTAVAIFDIDSIPLHKHLLIDAGYFLSGGSDIFGAAQKANHIPGSEVYASPAFCCFKRETWEKAGRPTFQQTQWHDTGGFFCAEASRTGAVIRLLWPINVEVPSWDLGDGKKFGHGTNYQDMVYHAFEARKGGERFINKCKEVINA